jgi:autotransporter-associated beta strand protein
VCCGGFFPRLVGVCCENVWRTGVGECCGGVWHAGVGVCCDGTWHTGEGVCCDGVWYTGTGECCGGTWHAGEGECCGGVWHPDSDPDGPCEEGHTFLQWGASGQCCGCLPPSYFDPEENGGLETPEEVAAALCCPTCPLDTLPIFKNESGECPGQCCDEEGCTDVVQSECTGVWNPVCCSVGCPKACCTEVASGEVECDPELPELLCTGLVADDCNGCLGACCEDGEPLGQTTAADCAALGGQWAGLGSTACQGEGDCRAPFTEACCESKQSSGAGLIFIQPYNKRTPPFFGTLKATVTGTTDSPILVHGIPVGTSGKRCPFSVSFLLCRDRFEIEPVPCATNFHFVDVEVCWEEQATNTEVLNFSACNGLSVALSDCTKNCVTTLDYKGPGANTNAAITLYGDATIAANGTGPLVLETAISHAGNCARTLTLSGASTHANAISTINGHGSLYQVSVVKDGPGLWRFTEVSPYRGGFTLKAGTVVVTTAGDGVLGASSGPAPVIGDTAANATPARLLLQAGVRSTRVLRVPAGSQEVVLGGYSSSGTAEFYNSQIRLGRPVTLTAKAGGTTVFSTTLRNFNGTGGAAVDISFGTAADTGLVVITGTFATSGTMNVRHGTVEVDGFGDLEAASFEVQPGATLIIRRGFDGVSDLEVVATMTSSTLTVAFPDDPEPEAEYVLLNGPTINTYGTVTITGTTATGTYDSTTSTLTID